MAKKYTLKQLISAIESKNTTLAQTIIESDDVNIGKQSARLLRCAIENDHLSAFSLLIENEQTNLTAGKHLAIKLCIESNREEMMHALLKTSAFDSVPQSTLYNFFKKATQLKHHVISKALIKAHGDKLNVTTTLSWIIKHDFDIAAKQLLKKNPDTLPFYFIKQAIKENASVELLSALIHSGCFDVQKIFDWSIKVKPSPVELLKILIEHPNVDPSVKSNVAICRMVKCGHIEIVKLLLDHPKVDPADQHNWAIRRAVFYEQTEILKLLLAVTDKGIDPNVENHYCLKKAAEKNNLEMVQLLLPYCSIHRMKLSHILKSDAEDLPQEVLNYFEYPESYVAAQPKFSASQKIGFTILEFKKNIQDWEKKKEAALINDEENAMNDESVIRAKTTFERKVQPAFADIFLSHAEKETDNKELSAIRHIERKIRKCILDAILASNPTQETLKFINENKKALCKATDAMLMKQAREQHFNSNSNTQHLAWRGYDADAPYKGPFDNLLTPPKKERVVFTTAAAKIDDNALLNTVASLYVRKMVAHYYLLAISSEFILEAEETLTDEGKNQIIAERVANLISELADMRSAHSDDYHGKPDAPSCYPGYLGRAANMGFKHPLTKETISTKNFIADIFESYIFTVFKKQLEACHSEIEGQQLLSALTLLSETGWRAQNIFLGQETYEDNFLKERTSFIQKLSTQEQSVNMINQALTNASRPTLNANSEMNGINEQSYVFQYLLDPARGKLSGKFSAEYLRWIKKFNTNTIEKTEEKAPLTEKTWYNPYTSSVTQINHLLSRMQSNPTMASVMSKRLKNAETKLALFDMLQVLVKEMPLYLKNEHNVTSYMLFTETLTDAVFECQKENIDDPILFSYKNLSLQQHDEIKRDLQEKLNDKSDHDDFAGALAIFEAFTAPDEVPLTPKKPSFTPQFQGTKTPPLSPSKSNHHNQMTHRSPSKHEKSPSRIRNVGETSLF